MTYSSSMALGRQRNMGRIGRNQNAVSFRRNERTLGPISNTVILIVLAAILGFLYLTQVTKTDAYGYKISSLQAEQAQLKSEHQDLEIASANMQSLARVQNSEVAKGLTPVAPSGIVH
jgi:outer membrane murein-binding lipoprotein Lpp